MEKLATDLTDLLNKYGHAMATSAEAVLVPRFRPGLDPLPDLTPIEQLRSKNTGKKFAFFPSQREKIAGALADFAGDRVAWLVWEPGCGKTAGALAIAWKKLNHKPYRLLVMCPGHLVNKWKREADWILPGVDCHIIKRFSDLKKFQALARTSKRPMVAVIGKDTAKLGFDVDKPCAARRKIAVRVQMFSHSDMQPGDRNFRSRKEPVDGWCMHPGAPHYQATRFEDVAACPDCGEVLREGPDEDALPIPYEKYQHLDEPLACALCGTRLLTSARGFRANPHLDRYIQRKMKGIFDMLIADEVHELAGASTCQGNALGTLAAACRYKLALTGTLIGGKASDLHASLWRLTPRLMRQRGFSLNPLKGSRISAIARNERAFVRRYGVMEQQVVRNVADDFTGRVYRGRCGRRKTHKTEERVRPGISPDLFNHFLIGHGVFMSLAELGPALPTLERVLVPVKASQELNLAYRCLDSDLEEAIKDKSHKGKGPPVLATIRVQALDAYLDRPWGWDPIVAPKYDEDGNRDGSEEVAWPQNLGEGYIDAKDEKLLEIVKSELKQGRRCGVYVQYTGVHDVRPKLLKLFADSGIKALALPDTVQPADRESWIEKRIGDMDVLICHPKRVMTGLDLIQFPSLIWYQTGYSTHVLRQASARARRPIQTLPCKVFFLYYLGTIQEQALGLMGEKEAASQALEGTFDTRALRAMMNGGKDDDIVSALANSLEKRVDATASWAKVQEGPANFPQAPQSAAPPIRPARRKPISNPSPRPLQASVLFDDEPVAELLFA